MQNEALTRITILGMALVTYATRAGGFWLMGLVTPSPRIEAWLKQIPGAVLVAIIAPTTPEPTMMMSAEASPFEVKIGSSCFTPASRRRAVKRPFNC